MRKRMIDPEFWLDEELAELSIEARLFYIGTWNFADDYGVIEYRIKKLKAQIFPYDDIDVEKCINELIKIGKLVPFNQDEKKYLLIKNFTKWQTIIRPSKRRFAIPPQNLEHSMNTQDTLNEYSMSTQDILNEHSMNTHPKKEKEKEKEKENNNTTITNQENNPSLKIKFDFKEGAWIGIENKDKKRWQDTYPYCDVELELKKMADWLLSNPNKKKKNYRRFITNWLSRQSADLEMKNKRGSPEYKNNIPVLYGKDTIAEFYKKKKKKIEGKDA